jgi:release factor glutamine methyltransferase
MSTYRELLQSGRELLKSFHIADADVDAWYLLAYVFKMNRTDLLLRGDQVAPAEQESEYRRLLGLRGEHIPLQYITGTQEFMGLEFRVSPDVLIPRQDTEILVEEVLKVSEGRRMLDMCTGSGCIIISIAKLGKPSLAAGADISEKALEIAAGNGKRNGVCVELYHSDLFEAITGSYDIIVSNPPYIPTRDIYELMPEVREHEPILALDGSEDGLEFYRRISAEAGSCLAEGGFLFYEIGYNQGEAVKQILLREGYTDIMIKKDLSGLDRVVSARRP